MVYADGVNIVGRGLTNIQENTEVVVVTSKETGLGSCLETSIR